MGGCPKCKATMGVIVLILGILFLLVDLGVWNFWNVKWWTALFLLWGLAGICMAKCDKECPTCKVPAKKKRKR